MVQPVIIFAAAALLEIAGCYAFWSVVKKGAPLWVAGLGLVALAGFAWLLTLTPTDAAGRAFAAYGGVYIAASLSWLWIVEGARPDRWDLIGAMVCLLGAGLILFGPRAG